MLFLVMLIIVNLLKTELGRQAGQLLEGILQEDAIVAVTGGSTMACVSEAIHLLPYNVFFVTSQRWTRRKCCLSGKHNCSQYGTTSWRLLYDRCMYLIMSVKQHINTLLLEPSVINTLDKIKQANVILRHW